MKSCIIRNGGVDTMHRMHRGLSNGKTCQSVDALNEDLTKTSIQADSDGTTNA